MRQPGIYVDVPLPSKEAIAARPRYFALQRKLHGLDLERDEKAVKAQKNKKQKGKQGSADTNSSSNRQGSASASVKGGSDQTNAMPAKTRAADSSIMIIDSSDDDEDNDTVQKPARQRRLVRGSRPQRRISSEGDVEVAKLGPDDEIDKIFGRKEHSEHGMLYTVRLSDKRKVIVTEDDMATYQDLLDDYQDRLDAGKLDEEPSEDEQVVKQPLRRSGRNRSAGAEGDYDERDDDGDEEESAGSELDEDDEDVIMSGDETRRRRKGKGRAVSKEPTRRSSREQTKKRVDYTMQDPETIEEEEEEEDQSGSDSDVEVIPTKHKAGARARVSKGSSSERYELESSNDEESETEISVGPTQAHLDDCIACKASSAASLLPMYMKKRKRKTSDGDWDEESIRALGCWVECESCTNSYHFKCIPATKLRDNVDIRNELKKALVSKYATKRTPKPHLNVDKTYKIPKCYECQKPKGIQCMICKSEEHRQYTRSDSDEEEVEVVATSRSSKSAEEEARPVPMSSASIVKSVLGEPIEIDDDGEDKEEDESMEVAAVNGSPNKADKPKVEAKDLLFRCKTCKRGAHYACIKESIHTWQYSHDWRCKNCVSWGAPDAMLAWRPVSRDTDTAMSGPPLSPSKRIIKPANLPNPKNPSEDAEYLVKFKEQSFRHVQWVPHAWLFAAHKGRLTHFLTKGPIIDIAPEQDEDDDDDKGLDSFGLQASPDAIEKIPKEWFTPDRILEVLYWPKGNHGADYIPSANMKRLSDDPLESIDRIAKIYVKWQGLAYESATWEEPFPKPDDPQYDSFVEAYRTFLRFKGIALPRPSIAQMAALDKPRPSGSYKPLKEQPDFITNGKLMDFQLEGVSWLYFNWWKKKGCILADEMGLGKTVQIISFISLLFREEGCLPFLVVVPNSTLQNWQREFEKWAPPELRVQPYYGSKASRDIIEEYEMFTSGPVSEQKLRAHVILTTYETIARSQALFKRVPRWEALVVDEAQRLKAGGTGLLWKCLRNLRIAHTVLLTGTPVNNNLGELFNLLHFIDPERFDDLDELNQKYAELTPALVEEVQALAQPYFLRRTKEAVLNLPPLSEVIVPLSMSPLQKIVYKSVLEHNYEALAAIYDSSKAKSKAKMNRSKVTNVLMELRKTLCHPYLVREELEHESTLDDKGLHKTLIEASSKLMFLREFLPKLKQKGHRVLLFSQFVIVLNIIERFLEGEKIKHVRLDGNTSQSDRQTAIDRYNAPNSEIGVFILSTRAGGVGINLATADTVIIFDADFNPFQDLQAISRAHRIGQKKKVMCFKLMIKGTCEEKIIEAGKRKMVLEQLVMDSIEDRKSSDEDEPNNVESLLLFGAKALFEESAEDAHKNEIAYSSQDMDDLIERTLKEGTSDAAVAEKEKQKQEANKAFSYARVWERTKAAQAEEEDKGEIAAQRGFWTRMLEEQQQQRQNEETARALQTGRGFRQRKETNYYRSAIDDVLGNDYSPGKRNKTDSPDPDFAVIEDDSEEEGFRPIVDRAEMNNLENGSASKKQKISANMVTPVNGSAAPGLGIGLVYNPPSGIENGMPSHFLPPAATVWRSITPVEIRERRAALIMNLAKRVAILNDPQATSLMAECKNAKEGPLQIKLCKQVTDRLRLVESRGSANGASSSSSMR